MCIRGARAPLDGICWNKKRTRRTELRLKQGHPERHKNTRDVVTKTQRRETFKKKTAFKIIETLGRQIR